MVRCRPSADWAEKSQRRFHEGDESRFPTVRRQMLARNGTSGGEAPFKDSCAWVGSLGLIRALICLLLISVPGCGEAEPTPEPVTITFAHAAFDTAFYEGLANEFNESHSRITVELRPQEPREWMRSNDLSVDGVDAFVALDSALTWLVKQGSVLNLDPFLEREEWLDLSDFYPGLIEHLSDGGKTWAVPAGVDVMVMFYSQDLFDRFDVPYLQLGWTWDDFLNIILTIHDPEADVFGYAPSNDLSDVVPFIYQHGGRLADDLQNPSRTTFDAPLTIEAVEWYAKLMLEYNVVPTPDEARRAFGGRGSSAAQGFLRGKLGMWAGSFSGWGGRYYWPGEWDMRWGMVPLPRDVGSATIASVEGYYISSQAQRPDACWQWIAFLSERASDRLIPARRSIVESAAYGQRVGNEIAAVARESLSGELLLFPIDMPEEIQAASGLFLDALDEIIDERSTPQEALEWAQQQSTFK
jgi:multiple sugar transport system substrate-binding protein